MRVSPTKIYRISVLLIGVSMVVQELYGLAQLSGLCRSGNYRYPFTGSFYNPGPFACYIALGVPVALRMMVNGNNMLQKWLGTGMVVAAAILIPASMSRTAMVACGIGGVIAVCDTLRSASRAVPRVRAVALTAMLICGASAVYLAKRDSADGRFLMWKVASQAAADAPALGVGWDNVAGAYGDAQERYFASGRGSAQEILVADAPQYVFNEYLQVAIAYGPGASIAMAAVISGAILIALLNHSYALAGSSAAVAVVMFASYPLQFPLSVVTIALILSGAWLSSRSQPLGWAMTALIAVTSGVFLTRDDSTDVLSQFSVAHTLHKMHHYRKSTDYLLKLLPHTADPMPLNIIAKNYRALAMPDSAEHYLIRSTRRCPNRLYPHYLLMQLYGDSTFLHPDRRRRQALLILNTREKIPSRAVNEMREEARKTLSPQ